MWAKTIIESARMERAVSVASAPRTDSTFCFYVDYRFLNVEIKLGTNSVPFMNEFIGSLGNITIFSALHENSRCRQLQVVEEYRFMTGITSRRRRFHFIPMLHGFRSSSESF